MKICPRCSKTYTDENLNFCLEDGSVLEQASGSAMPETVLLNQPRITAPAQQVPSQQFPQQQMQQQQQAGWNTAPQQYSMQPKKSSKTWVWVLVILGFLGLMCGGGVVGFFVYVGSQVDLANANTSGTNSNTGTNTKKGGPFDSNTKSTGTNTSNGTPSTSGRTSSETVDLNDWVRANSSFGNTEFKSGEFFMSAKQKGYYYVLAAPADTAKTESADTSVVVRNVDNSDSRLGYGIVFHSNPTPLQQGYAFLIDTKKLKYRVVHHAPQAEDPVVNWTKSDAINAGAAENTLEVRDQADKIELYINGKMVNSIKNVYGYKGGVVGLYSGDGINIGFKNLELKK